MKTIITAGEKLTPPIIYKIEKFMIGLMICSFALTYFANFLANELLLAFFMILIGLSIITLFITAIIHFFIAMKTDSPEKIIFNDKNFIVYGIKLNPDNMLPRISAEPISYNTFSQVRLNLNISNNNDSIKNPIELLTDSDRCILIISLYSYSKEKIEQILQEFQKHGKSVKIAPELYGLYSIIDTNGEII